MTYNTWAGIHSQRNKIRFFSSFLMKMSIIYCSEQERKRRKEEMLTNWLHYMAFGEKRLLAFSRAFPFNQKPCNVHMYIHIIPCFYIITKFYFLPTFCQWNCLYGKNIISISLIGRYVCIIGIIVYLQVLQSTYFFASA